MRLRINKKRVYIIAIVILLIILVILSSSCSKKRKNYCIPPKAITGVCHTLCGSPAECHLSYPGDKGTGCYFGQVCDDRCECVWVDKDLDGYPSKNLGKMKYLLDCDDEDPTVFPNSPEICDNKDNDCDNKIDIDEGGVCNKNVYFCKTDIFVYDTETCVDGLWCSASTLGTSTSCDYTTTTSDVGQKDVYTFVCDNYFKDGDYGCYKFIKGSFTVLTTCDNDNVIDETEECDGTELGGLTCLDFGYTGGTLKCDRCTYDFNDCTGVVCNHNNKKEPGEECDGTDLNGKTCLYFNLPGNNLKCNDACLFDKSECVSSLAVCGNYVVELGENCDGANLNGMTCKDFGFIGGTLLCEKDCTYDYSNCMSVGCDNDNIAELGESCDGTDLDGRTCQFFGFTGGVLECAGNCEFNFSGCNNYGCDNDGIAEDGEACDGNDLRGKTCKDFDMFKGGLLKCTPECMFDRDECSLTCDNDNIAEIGEECDGVDLRGKTCENLGRYGGILGCSLSCMFDLANCGPACLEEWSCTAWSNCSQMTDNTTRVCTDSKGCGTNYFRPAEVKPCDPGVCVDDDGDGYCACYGTAFGCDCDDNNAAINPGVIEVCNDRDDNCDAVIDDGCLCGHGDNRTCGINEGLCREGIQRCLNGYWSICSGSYIGPRPEVCDNGLDEDCDGYPDDGCVCDDNSTQECGTDVGECKKGTQICFAGNWSACSGSVDPLTEVCSGGKDEDCDTYLDCDDDSCSSSSYCTGTGPTGPTPNCFDGKKNQGETGIDCGGPCPACEDICGFGSISQACVCEGTTRTSGYCCNGKYQIDSCTDSCTDSDGDTLCDSDEIRQGTNPNNPDTDGDGITDDMDDMPLCNKDGRCDSSREFPENILNCPDDCSEEKGGLGLLWWIIIILLILIVGALVFYVLVKKDIIKLKKKKKEEPKLVLTQQPLKPAVQPAVTTKKMRDISKLVDYLDKSLKKGDSKIKLREFALKAGWSNDEVNRAFDSLAKKTKDTNKKFFSIFKK